MREGTETEAERDAIREVLEQTYGLLGSFIDSEGQPRPVKPAVVARLREETGALSRGGPGVIFDHDTAKKALRDEVTLTLRLQRPKVARAQLIPLSVNGQGMLGRLHVRCVWRTYVGGPWEAPWGIEDPEASVGRLGFPSMDAFRQGLA
jgi:hypothetical protein